MAQQAIGNYGKTVIDWESSFGVTPSTKKGFDLPFITNTVAAKQELVKSNVITGRRSQSIPAYGNVDVAGSLTAPVDLGTIGHWLKGAIGAPVTTGTTDFSHVFKVGTALPSMLIERLVGSQYFQYNGCLVDTFKISIGGDQELTVSVDIVGCKSVTGTVPYNAAAEVVTQTNKLNNFQPVVKIGGVASSVLKTCDMTISNNLDKNGYTIGGGGFRTSVVPGLITCSGTVKALFTDMSLVNLGINQTKTSVEFVWDIDATHSLTFLFPEVNFSRVDPTIAGPGGVEIDLNWEAFYQSDSNASAVVVTLENSVADY